MDGIGKSHLRMIGSQSSRELALGKCNRKAAAGCCMWRAETNLAACVSIARVYIVENGLMLLLVRPISLLGRAQECAMCHLVIVELSHRMCLAPIIAAQHMKDEDILSTR